MDWIEGEPVVDVGPCVPPDFWTWLTLLLLRWTI